MARFAITTVTLSAGQAAGTLPILAAESGAIGIGTRRLVSVASRSAAATELFTASGGTTGNGVPLAIGGRYDMPGGAPPFDGELYILGATAGEKIVLITA